PTKCGQARSTSAGGSDTVGQAGGCGAIGASASPRSSMEGGRSGEGGMAASVSPLRAVTAERRIAVVDLGSNSFRLVVFRSRPGRSFALTDEIRESVRLSAGAGGGALQPEAAARAAAAARLYGPLCRATRLGAGV